MGNNEPQPVPRTQRIIFFNQQLIWLDPNYSEEEFTMLSKIFLVKKIETVEEYFDYVKQKQINNDLLLICAGSLFESLEQQLKLHQEQAQKIKKIFIFCFDKQKNIHLLNRQKVVYVTNKTEDLIKEIKKEKLSQIQLFSFRNLQDNDAKTIPLQYSYFLTFLTYPIQESKRSQLIMKCVNSINKNKIPSGEDFDIKSYPRHFEPIQILKLFKCNQFYDYLNKILKISNFARIEEVHILIHDLHQTIQQYSSFTRRSSIPSVLFRGSLLSLLQIESLQKSIGSFIQILNFLSTSIDFQVPTDSFFPKNVIFKIYIPKFFKDKTFRNIKLRGGYVELSSLITSNYPGEQEVLFNIKSVFVILRVQRKLQKVNEQQIQMFIIQLIYGIDQIMVFLNQNKKDFTTQIHNKSPGQTQQKCKNCDSTLHLIGTSSKKTVCLKKFDSSRLFNQSFVLENSKNKITGITVDYDELVLQHYKNQGSQQYSSLCKKCQGKVKCSGCFSEFCLCSLHDHNQQHLENCHILVERDLPRYVMLELNESQASQLQNHYLLDSQITCSADVFRLMKDKSSFQKAWQQYNAMIEREDFYSLDYTTQFNLYENRAESYRLRKYLIDAEKEKMTIEKLKFCIEDYERCYELVKDQLKQIYKQSKSIMMIGIVEVEIASLIEQHEINKQLPLFSSEKMYNQALNSYKRARNILSSKKKNQLTHEQILLEMNIINCQACLYSHKQNFQKAVEQFQSIIVSMNNLQKSDKIEKAKFLNNTVECMNIFVEKLNWKDLNYIENILKRANDYGKQSYELRLSLFGAKYNQTLNSKQNYEKAVKLHDECQEKIKQKVVTKQK